MAADIVNFSFKTNEIFGFTVESWKDSTGNQIDLQGHKIRLQVRDINGELVLDGSTENGYIKIDTDNQIEVKFPLSVTKIADLGCHDYDMLDQYNTDDPVVIIEGTVEIRRGVTSNE